MIQLCSPFCESGKQKMYSERQHRHNQQQQRKQSNEIILLFYQFFAISISCQCLRLRCCRCCCCYGYCCLLSLCTDISIFVVYTVHICANLPAIVISWEGARYLQISAKLRHKTQYAERTYWLLKTTTTTKQFPTNVRTLHVHH